MGETEQKGSSTPKTPEELDAFWADMQPDDTQSSGEAAAAPLEVVPTGIGEGLKKADKIGGALASSGLVRNMKKGSN